MRRFHGFSLKEVPKMIIKEALKIFTAARKHGWVMEPEAKKLLVLAGVPVPKFHWAKEASDCLSMAAEIGYPLVAKVVSPDVVHKSDSGGVEVGLRTEEEVLKVYDRFSRFSRFSGVLLEEMVGGIELIVGAKIDYQFGPVILVGIGGTGVEIYKDTIIRMAPLTERDIAAMTHGLKGHELLEGHRGAEPVNFRSLSSLLLSFSTLVMELESEIESIDLNPVFCNAEHSVVADARIILKSSQIP